MFLKVLDKIRESSALGKHCKPCDLLISVWPLHELCLSKIYSGQGTDAEYDQVVTHFSQVSYCFTGFKQEEMRCLVVLYLLIFNAAMWFTKEFCPSINYVNV